MMISQTEIPAAEAATERRLVMRLVDYWEQIRGDWSFPLITDFDVTAVDGLDPHSFLIALDPDNLEGSAFRFVGDKIAAECGGDLAGLPVFQVPRGTLLSRLTDHYLQVLANECPMGFEAAFSHAENMETLYRGIMLPMSDDGQRLDYILGAINCRERQIQEDEKTSDFFEGNAGPETPVGTAANDVDGSAIGLSGANGSSQEPDLETAMTDKLQDCRGVARMVTESERVARKALFEALRKAFALARLADTAPMTYGRILKEHDIVPQPGQPFLTVLQLTFGESRDPDQLAEYAAALSYAERQGQTPETLVAFLEEQEDGIEGCARAEPIPEIPIGTFNRRVREGAL